jgi:hypothetical protein
MKKSEAINVHVVIMRQHYIKICPLTSKPFMLKFMTINVCIVIMQQQQQHISIDVAAQSRTIFSHVKAVPERVGDKKSL